MRRLFLLGPVLSCLVGAPLHAQEAGGGAQSVELTNAELFAVADAARDRGELELAAQAYEALAENEEGPLKREALFRLAMLRADLQQRYADAAVLFRRILDEEPDNARVRIELARMQAMMGNLGEASRELRAAQAAGLPPEVEQMVRFYAQALTAQRPFGASFRVALAPDSNINRATRSDTLDTILGDFTLDEDAQETSGVGLSLQGQLFGKVGIDKRSDLLLRLSASGDVYRESQFDDYIVALQAGPQYRLWGGTLDVAATASHRWFGQESYSLTVGATADYRLPVSDTAQLRVSATVTDNDNRRNDLQDGTRLALRSGVDLALDARSGLGANLMAVRTGARDPGYANITGGIDGYLYREFGSVTAVLDLSYSHLEADRRLLLFPERRVDDRFSVALSGTLRTLRLGNFAPVVKVEYEKNLSTVGIYKYNRLAGEIGVAAAF